jgi:flavoprotein
VSIELVNKAYAYLLTAPTDAINTVTKACAHLLTTLTNAINLATKADLFVYSIIAKSCYTFIVFIRIIVNTGVFKKFIANYKQF